MEMVLFEMLGKVTERIKSYDIAKEAAVFAEALIQNRKDIFLDLPGGPEGEQAGEVAEEIALKQLKLIQDIPLMADVMADQIVRPDLHPSVRLLQVTALAYLVNPDDLIPDDLPGGYGFVDDTIMLRSTKVAVPYVYELNAKEVEQERLNIDFMGMCIPRDVALQFESSVERSITLLQLMAFLPAFVIQDTTRRIIENPFVSFEPQPPPGMTWPSPPGSGWFRLADGGLGRSENGGIHYNFDDGSGVSLVSGDLVPSFSAAW